MCQSADPISHIRIMRCSHGTNFVALGNVTLHLSDPELALLDQTIHKLARREPKLQHELSKALCANDEPDVPNEPEAFS